MDALTADPSGLTPASVGGVLALTPAALVAGYGLARAGASLCNELRNAVFAKVGGCRGVLDGAMDGFEEDCGRLGQATQVYNTAGRQGGAQCNRQPPISFGRAACYCYPFPAGYPGRHPQHCQPHVCAPARHGPGVPPAGTLCMLRCLCCACFACSTEFRCCGLGSLPRSLSCCHTGAIFASIRHAHAATAEHSPTAWPAAWHLRSCVLQRQTGAVSRVIDRGTRGINFILRWGAPCSVAGAAFLQRSLTVARVRCSPQAFGFQLYSVHRSAVALCSSMVFNVVPTAFEVSLVAGILAYKCGPQFAALTAATIAAYTYYTFTVTQVRHWFFYFSHPAPPFPMPAARPAAAPLLTCLLTRNACPTPARLPLHSGAPSSGAT